MYVLVVNLSGERELLVEEVEFRTSYIKLFWFLNQYHSNTRLGTLFIVTTYIFF